MPLDDMLLKSRQDKDKNGNEADNEKALREMKTAFEETPLHSILSFSSSELKYEDIQETLKKLNNTVS